MRTVVPDGRSEDFPGEAKVNSKCCPFCAFSGDNVKEDAAWFADKTNRDNIISYYEGSPGRSFSNYIDAISYGKLKVYNIFQQDNGTGIESYCPSLSSESAQKVMTETDILII